MSPIPINADNGGAVFHEGHDDMHGFTCVLESGVDTYIGRWEHNVDGVIILKGASHHQDGEEGMRTKDFIEKTAKFGLVPKQPQIEVEAAGVTSVRKLGDVAKAIRGF